MSYIADHHTKPGVKFLFPFRIGTLSICRLTIYHASYTIRYMSYGYQKRLSPLWYLIPILFGVLAGFLIYITHKLAPHIVPRDFAINSIKIGLLSSLAAILITILLL